MAATDTTPSPAALLYRTEELHPDLACYVYDVDVLGEVLKAPLVFIVPYLPQLAAIANRTYRGKLQALARAESEGKWQKVLWLHEKPYRMAVFLQVRDQMSDRDYWQALGSLWLETENLHEDQDEWVAALTANRAGRAQWLMDKTERAVLAGLNEQVTVHRGFRRPGRHLAPSWTLDPARAEWFARRAIDPGTAGYLATVTVPKSSVIAYFAGRGEQEIVLDPGQLPEPQITQAAAG